MDPASFGNASNGNPARSGPGAVEAWISLILVMKCDGNPARSGPGAAEAWISSVLVMKYDWNPTRSGAGAEQGLV